MPKVKKGKSVKKDPEKGLREKRAAKREQKENEDYNNTIF